MPQKLFIGEVAIQRRFCIEVPTQASVFIQKIYYRTTNYDAIKQQV